RLESRALLDQHGDLAREARPVDVREMPELLEPGKCLQPALQRLACLLDLGDALPAGGEGGFDAFALIAQRAQLVGVAPAEHVPAAVADPTAVVLLVAPARVLDLTGAGDG